MYININDLPSTIQNALRRRGYNRKDIEIKTKETFYTSGYGVSDGRYGFCDLVNIDNGDIKSFNGSWGGSNMFVQTVVDDNRKSMELPINCVVINGSKGGGHSSINGQTLAQLTMHPKNMNPKLLTNVLDTKLDEKVFNALLGIKSLTSKGRKEYYPRKGLGQYNAQNPLILDLYKNGLVKISSAGSISITTKGKNVVGNRYA